MDSSASENITRRELGARLLAGGIALSSSLPNRARAQEQAGRIGEPLPELEAWIVDRCMQNNIPSCSSAIVQGDEIVWAFAHGVDDVRTQVPASIDRVFIWGSISKTVTATVCMKLAEAGKIDLDRDLSEYVGFLVRNPYFPEATITIRQILTHSSSLLDGDFVLYGQSYRHREAPTPPREMMKALYDSSGPGGKQGSVFFGRYAPGESVRYANSTFGLISIALSEVLGKPDLDVFKEVVFEPLGMRASIDPTQFARFDYVTPHFWVDGGMPEDSFLSWDDPSVPFWDFLIDDDRKTERAFSGFTGHSQFLPDYTFGTYADGGVISGLRDMAKFASVFAQRGKFDGSYFLSPQSISEMTEPVGMHHDWPGNQAVGFHQGYPYSIDGFNWGHNGHDIGTKTTLRFDQERGIALVSHCNLEQPALATFDTDPEFFRRALFALDRQEYVP